MPRSKTHERAEVIADSFLEAGFDILGPESAKGGHLLRVYVRRGGDAVGAVRVLDSGVVVDWEVVPGEMARLLRQGGVTRIGVPQHRTITPNTTVYSAAAWWEGSDPFTSVVALDKKRTEDIITESMLEEARWAADRPEPEDEQEADVDYQIDQIRLSGVHAEKLGSLAKDEEFEKAAEALAEYGYWHPELP